MSLPIDPSHIPIDPFTGQPESLASFMQRPSGVIPRGLFSVVGADIGALRYNFSGNNQVTYDEYIMACAAENDNNTTTQWQNLITSQEVTRTFYLANSLNVFSPFRRLSSVIQDIFDTQINDPNYISYVNNGIKGIVANVNSARSQFILQTVDSAPPGYVGVWNGVTEEAYRVNQVNNAINAYLANPSASLLATLNAVIASYNSYSVARNALIASYNASVNNYNSQVASINTSIDTFNATYQSAAAIAPIPHLETTLPQYASLGTGLALAPPAPSPLADGQYAAGGLAALQALPFADVSDIPSIGQPPDYSDSAPFSVINSYFAALNSEIASYNTLQVGTNLNSNSPTFGPENMAINNLNAAIVAWNASNQTQTELDTLNNATAAYNAVLASLNAQIEAINVLAEAFNTGASGQTLQGLNDEINRQNIIRATYGLTPIPLYNPLPLRESMPVNPVNANLTLTSAPKTVLPLSSPREAYATVPLMTQNTIDDNYIISGAIKINTAIGDAFLFTQFQLNNPAFLGYSNILSGGGLNVLYNQAADLYLNAGGAPWPTTLYFGVPLPSEPATANLSPASQQLIKSWIDQVIAQSTNPAILQNALNDYNAYVNSLNSAITAYNSQIGAVNILVGIPAYSPDIGNSSVAFSQYGAIPPPSGILNVQTIDQYQLLPTPPTTTQIQQTFVRIDAISQQIVSDWLQQVLANGLLTSQDKNAAQAQYDAYTAFVAISIPDVLPDTLNGYAATFNGADQMGGMVGPLPKVPLLTTLSPVPNLTIASTSASQVQSGPTELPLFFTFEQNSLNPARAGFSDLGYLEQAIYGPLVNTTIPQYNQSLNSNQGLLAENDAITPLNAAIAAYQMAAAAFNNPSNPDYGLPIPLASASNNLANAAQNYTVVVAGIVNPNIAVLNQSIEQWNAAIGAANAQLAFWGLPQISAVYSITARALMPAAPQPNLMTSAYDPNNPPTLLVERSAQAYPSTGGGALLGLSLLDFLSEAARIIAILRSRRNIAYLKQLFKRLQQIDSFTQFQLNLAGQQVGLLPAYIAKEPPLRSSGINLPNPGLASLALGFSAPAFSRLLVSNVISALNGRDTAINVMGFDAVIALSINELINKASFLSFINTLGAISGRLPSPVNFREELIQELIAGSLAMTFFQRAIDLIDSNVVPEVIGNIFGRSNRTGKPLDVLGISPAYLTSLVDINLLLEAARRVAPAFPELAQELLAGSPALNELLHPNIWKGRKLHVLKDSEILHPFLQLIKAAAVRAEKALRREQPIVWSYSAAAGFIADKLPREILAVQHLAKKAIGDLSSTYDPTESLILANTIQNSMESNQIVNAAILRDEIIREGMHEASLYANRDANPSPGQMNNPVNVSIGSVNISLINAFNAIRAVQDDLEEQLVLRNLIKSENVQQSEINRLLLEINRLLSEQQEEASMRSGADNKGVTSEVDLKSYVQVAIQSLFGASATQAGVIATAVRFEGHSVAGAVAGEAHFEAPYDPRAKEVAEAVVSNWLTESRIERQVQVDLDNEYRLNKEDSRRKDLTASRVKFQQLVDEHIRTLVKHSDEEKIRELAGVFRSYIDDLLVQQPRDAARNDPTLRAAYNLAVPGGFVRSVDINV